MHGLTLRNNLTYLTTFIDIFTINSAYFMKLAVDELPYSVLE